MTDSQSVPEQRSLNFEIIDFANFAKLPKKNKITEKFEVLDKRGFKPTEMRKSSHHPANPPS